MYKLMPKSYKRKIQKWITYSGSQKTPMSFCNSSFIISLVIALVASLFFLTSVYILVIFIGVFIGAFAVFHAMLLFAMDRRTKMVESMLPDALQLVAANIKSGYIPSRALMLSARKEFGPLSEAIKRAGKEMMTGKSFEDSLNTITSNIKSDILETTIKLVIKGVRSGGQLVTLFEETALTVRRRQAIQGEIRANIMMYTIFIGFAGAVGAPVLYGLTSFLVETMTNFAASAQAPQEFMGQGPFMRFGMQAPPVFLFEFAILAILVTSVFGGLIIGLIGTGKESSGIKYILPMLVASLSIFFAVRFVITSTFGAMLPF